MDGQGGFYARKLVGINRVNHPLLIDRRNSMKKATEQILALALLTLILAGCSTMPYSLADVGNSLSQSYSDANISNREATEIRIPSPQISTYISYINSGNNGNILEYYDKDQQHNVIPVPYQDPECWFASDTLWAVAGSEEGVISGAVSANFGQSWGSFQINVEKDFILEKILQIGFTSEKNGWIICREALNYAQLPVKYGLIQTSDGGQNWALRSIFETAERNPVFTFASPDIGWMDLADSYKEKPILWQTDNGGNSWEAAVFCLPENMEYGEAKFEETGPWFTENRWELRMSAIRQSGYPAICEYTLTWSQLECAWIWDTPSLDLPAGTNALEFYDYINFFAYPPMEYSSQQGLGSQPSVWILFDTAEHLGRVRGVSMLGKTISFSEVKEMAEVEYEGEFDVEHAAAYWSEVGLADCTGEGIVYNGSWLKNTDFPSCEMISSACLEDGTIEVILKRAVSPLQEQEFDYSTDGISPALFQRCVFRPVEWEGIQYYTLIHAETLKFYQK